MNTTLTILGALFPIVFVLWIKACRDAADLRTALKIADVQLRKELS